MIPYSLKQLSYFVAAAELKSTSAAARSLHVSQPSISAAIKQLESVLGQTLLIRHQGQGVSPTPHGRELVARAKQLLNLAENLSFEKQSDASGSIILGCFVDISPYYLPEILLELGRQYPDIRCRIVNAELHEMAHLLKQGELDIGITYGVLLEEGIDYQSLAVVTPSAMLSANHPLSQLEQTFELQRGMVANGLGVSLSYTQPLCSKSYDGKEVVYRPIVETLPSQEIVLARNSKSALTAVTEPVWELVRQRFETLHQTLN